MKEKHGDACKEESDQRKVKVKEVRKVRKEAEKTRVDNESSEILKRCEDTDLAAPLCEDFKRATLEAVEQVASVKMSKKK